MRKARASEDWCGLARLIAGEPVGATVRGAEINCIEDLLRLGYANDPPACLHFCVSDTVVGGEVGEVLTEYYESQGYAVETHRIDGLREDDSTLFRTVGLRNLVRQIGQIVRNAGDPRLAVINATGGFKAQMAVAVIIGQALGVGVFYKHERFPEIISFPPLPISLDYDLLGQHAGLLCQLEHGEVIAMEPEEMVESLRVLLDEVPGDGPEHYWALGPIGQIYLEGFRQRYPAERSLPAACVDRKAPSFRDDHYPKGFRDYVQKVWSEQPYIKHCHSLPYDRQQGIRNGRFYLRPDDTLVGEFQDKNNFGSRFAITTTATNRSQLLAAVLHLNTVYGV
jgi:putative CRISPR-associated protein (TIGR02619 family)